MTRTAATDLPRASGGTGVRRAELLASLSLALDVGLGQPMEHILRSCRIAVRLAEALGLEDRPHRSGGPPADGAAKDGADAS